MKIMHCPLNGPRNISEFAYGGEVEDMPDPVKCGGDEWVEYIFMSGNPAGLVRERNTVTDEIIKTYPPSELFGQRIEFTKGDD